MASTTRLRYTRRKFNPGLLEDGDDALALCPASRGDPDYWPVPVQWHVYSDMLLAFRFATLPGPVGPRVKATPFEDGWLGIYIIDHYVNRSVVYETFEDGDGDISEHHPRATRAESALVFWAVWMALDEI